MIKQFSFQSTEMCFRKACRDRANAIKNAIKVAKGEIKQVQDLLTKCFDIIVDVCFQREIPDVDNVDEYFNKKILQQLKDYQSTIDRTIQNINSGIEPYLQKYEKDFKEITDEYTVLQQDNINLNSLKFVLGNAKKLINYITNSITSLNETYDSIVWDNLNLYMGHFYDIALSLQAEFGSLNKHQNNVTFEYNALLEEKYDLSRKLFEERSITKQSYRAIQYFQKHGKYNVH
tara:strand:- start:353 stop:1048 length:696 start_codon:yes stop_codon:yes gene_type:complete